MARITAALLALVGACATHSLPAAPRKGFPPVPGRVLSRTAQEEKSLESYLHPGRTYVLLVDAYPIVKKLSRLVGFSGEYGHVEAIYDGHAYGCRPPVCSVMDIPSLERYFAGHRYELREIDISGSVEFALDWFREQQQGKRHDWGYNNCADAVMEMYLLTGARHHIIPVDVDVAYNERDKLRRFMERESIPRPEGRWSVYFPDQFAVVGELVSRGRFPGQEVSDGY